MPFDTFRSLQAGLSPNWPRKQRSSQARAAPSGICTPCFSPVEPTLPLVFAFAERLRLPGNGLRDALATGAFAARVRDVAARGAQSGVEGTPTFFIDGRRHSAPVCFDTLAAGIGQAIERSGRPHAALRLHG